MILIFANPIKSIFTIIDFFNSKEAMTVIMENGQNLRYSPGRNSREAVITKMFIFFPKYFNLLYDFSSFWPNFDFFLVFL